MILTPKGSPLLQKKIFLFIKIEVKVVYTSLVAQSVKNLPAMQEAWVQSLGQEDPLEKGMAPLQYSFLFIYLFIFIFKLYNIVLVLPNIEMNSPQVYLCSPS